MSFAHDDCTTYADAIARAKRVQALRQAAYKPRPAPPPVTNVLPPPRPRVVIVASPPTPPLATPAPLPPTPVIVNISARMVAREVAAYFDTPLADIFSERRTGDITIPRHIAMYLASKVTSLSYPSIGRALGGRDHSTIIHAKDKIETLLKAGNAQIATAVRELTAILSLKYAHAMDAIRKEPPLHLPVRQGLHAQSMKPWSAEETERLTELGLKECRSAKYIAHELGRSADAVKHQARKLGFRLNRWGPR